jgi:hypothetical protein
MDTQYNLISISQKKFFNSPRYLKVSITLRFHQKRIAKLSAAAKNEKWNLALSSKLRIFSSYHAFSAKIRS